MKKPLLWVGVLLLSILMVVSLSLAGCKTTAATETKAAAETTAAATAATGKHFAGISIYFSLEELKEVHSKVLFIKEQKLQKRI
jgi:hypothetical protein